VTSQEWEFGPSTSSLSWTDPVDGSAWTLDLTFQGPVEPTGVVECVGLTLRAAGAPRAVKTSHLRRLNLATLIGREKARLGAIFRQAAEASVPWEQDEDRFGAMARGAKAVQTELAEGLQPRSQAQPRPGRPAKYERSHFELVARVYADNYRGMASTPTKAVAEHFGASPATAKKWVSRARRMGLLGPTAPGQPGGTRPARRKS
jgi:hypothetical protein